jgi:hypothetical protein
MRRGSWFFSGPGVSGRRCRGRLFWPCGRGVFRLAAGRSVERRSASWPESAPARWWPECRPSGQIPNRDARRNRSSGNRPSPRPGRNSQTDCGTWRSRSTKPTTPKPPVSRNGLASDDTSRSRTVSSREMRADPETRRVVVADRVRCVSQPARISRALSAASVICIECSGYYHRQNGTQELT